MAGEYHITLYQLASCLRALLVLGVQPCPRCKPRYVQDTRKHNLDPAAKAAKDLGQWMSTTFQVCGELDPRSGTIWLSPTLYPTKKSLYQDYLVHHEAQMVDANIPLDSPQAKGPAESTFYKVRFFRKLALAPPSQHPDVVVGIVRYHVWDLDCQKAWAQPKPEPLCRCRPTSSRMSRCPSTSASPSATHAQG